MWHGIEQPKEPLEYRGSVHSRAEFCWEDHRGIDDDWLDRRFYTVKTTALEQNTLRNHKGYEMISKNACASFEIISYK